MKSITIHNIPDNVFAVLSKEAQKKHLSLNKAVKMLLAESLGISDSEPDQPVRLTKNAPAASGRRRSSLSGARDQIRTGIPFAGLAAAPPHVGKENAKSPKGSK